MGEARGNGRRKRSRELPPCHDSAKVDVGKQLSIPAGYKRYRTYREKYRLIETIGEGTYGVVYKAIEAETGRVVALKKIRTTNADDGLPATSLREIKLLKSLSHPNIIKLHAVFHEPMTSLRAMPILLLEFDYLECDLRKFTKRFPKRRLPLPVVKIIMRQVLSALQYCHEQQIIHRDMKPSNILMHFKHTKATCKSGSRVSAGRSAYQLLQEIDEGVWPDGNMSASALQLLTQSVQVKLADFGLARIYPVPLRPLTHEVVTLWYRAPEVVLGFDHYTTSIDIWSTGCIFLELLHGRPIFSGDSEMETLYRVFQLLGTPTEREWPNITTLPCWKSQWPVWPKRRDRFDYVRDDLDDNAKDLIDRMLRFAPESRCTAAEALMHPWFCDVSPAPAHSSEGKATDRLGSDASS